MSDDGPWWLNLPPCPRCSKSHVLTDCAERLDEIRERYRTSFTTLPGGTWAHANSADDVPRLLAAVDAVLKLTAEWEELPFADLEAGATAADVRETIGREMAKDGRGTAGAMLAGLETAENSSVPAGATGEDEGS